MSRSFINLTNKKFGKLIVKNFYNRNKNNRLLWFCQCECGNKIITEGSLLRSGRTKSCGCISKLKLKKRLLIHGQSKHPLFNGWNARNHNCHNPKIKTFLNYGARGIIVCKEWRATKFGGLSHGKGLLNFLKWAQEQAEKQEIPWEDILYKKNGKKSFYSIDRINNNKSYYPKNCKFSTQKEQMNNTRPRISNFKFKEELNNKDNYIKLLKNKIKKYEKL